MRGADDSQTRFHSGAKCEIRSAFDSNCRQIKARRDGRWKLPWLTQRRRVRLRHLVIWRKRQSGRFAEPFAANYRRARPSSDFTGTDRVGGDRAAKRKVGQGDGFGNRGQLHSGLF